MIRITATALIACLSFSAQAQRMSCETVRAYVAQYGREQARQLGRAYGMTANEEHEATQCLARNYRHHHNWSQQ